MSPAVHERGTREGTAPEQPHPSSDRVHAAEHRGSIGKLAEAKSCYTARLDTSDPYTRAEGLWGLERYKDASDQFKLAAAEK